MTQKLQTSCLGYHPIWHVFCLKISEILQFFIRKAENQKFAILPPPSAIQPKPKLMVGKKNLEQQQQKVKCILGKNSGGWGLYFCKPQIEPRNPTLETSFYWLQINYEGKKNPRPETYEKPLEWGFYLAGLVKKTHPLGLSRESTANHLRNSSKHYFKRYIFNHFFAMELR